MADLYEQLLGSIGTLTPEQLSELASIINAKQLLTYFPGNEPPPNSCPRNLMDNLQGKIHNRI